MSQEFHAIYEHGVLRPLTPLHLPESAEVIGTVQEENGAAGMSAHVDPIVLQRQQQALDAMFREIDKLPQTPYNDDLSGRDHDRILYGSLK